MAEFLLAFQQSAPAELLGLWHTLAAVLARMGAPLWLHGDLHAGNLVLGPDGDLRGVVAFSWALSMGSAMAAVSDVNSDFCALGSEIPRSVVEG